jgi:hypothetical protein
MNSEGYGNIGGHKDSVDRHTWRGKTENAAATQQALYQRAFLNGAARTGEYTSDMETETYI